VMTTRPWRQTMGSGVAVCRSAAVWRHCWVPRDSPAAVPRRGARAHDNRTMFAPRVSDIIAREHYRPMPLDDRLSSLMPGSISRCNSPRRRAQFISYASDIAEFEKSRYELDDAIKSLTSRPPSSFSAATSAHRERIINAIGLLSRA